MSTDDQVPTTPRSFWRSRWTWSVIGVPAAFLSLVGWLWYSSAHELQSKLDELKAAGLPTSASEVNDFYKVPAGVTDRTLEWVAAIDAVEAANLSKIGAGLPIVGDNANPIPPPGQPWPDLEASRILVRGLDQELQLIRKAASVPGQVHIPVDFSAGVATLLPEIQIVRHVSRLLKLEAHVSAHEGDFARTLQDIKDMFALSHLLSGEPCHISELVRFAVYSMAVSTLEELFPACSWTDAELASLQQSLGTAPFEAEMQKAMASETALLLTEFDKAPLGPFRQANKLGLVKFMEETRRALSRPWPEPLRLQAKSVTQLQSMTNASAFNRYRYMMLSQFAPTTGQVGQATCRAVARQRCLHLGLAAYRYQLQHGQLPDTLAALDASLFAGQKTPAELTIDPFDGQPLRTRRDTTGLLIYSVSQNLVDDGGDVIYSDAKPTPGDLGFQVHRLVPSIK